MQTRDLAKGSATSDPDGFPLYYAGSRDNHLRVVALDRSEPQVLWQLERRHLACLVHSATTTGTAPPLVVDDYLLEGGENGWFYVIRLNRGYDGKGS